VVSAAIGSAVAVVSTGALVSAGAVSSASVLVGSSASTIITQSVKLMTRLICDHFIKRLPP